MSKLQKIIISAVAAAVLVLSLAGVFAENKGARLGSVNIGNEYQATTTSTGRFATGPTVLCTSGGSIGNVNITGAAAGILDMYDATTSAITSRAAHMATSSILLVNFNTSAAAGSFALDRVFFNGLLVNFSGTMPTTTISYRCQ